MEKIREKTRRTVKKAQKTAQESISRDETAEYTGKESGRQSRFSCPGRRFERLFREDGEFPLDETLREGEEALRRTAQAAQKTAQTAGAKKAAQESARAAKGAASALRQAVSAAVRGTAALLENGGWLAVILIAVLVILLGLSAAGVNVAADEGDGVRAMIRTLDAEFAGKIREEKAVQPYDVLRQEGSRMDWQTMLCLFFTKEGMQGAAVLTDTQQAALRELFWQVNSITAERRTEDGRSILYLTVRAKSAQEMMTELGFDMDQRRDFQNLYADALLWQTLLFGSAAQDSGIIEAARSQIGNRGGEPYWSWYGFSHRVPWCACFVSWCADQCGLIESGVLPKFSSCSAGIRWFQDRGRWYSKDTVPSAGMIVFFDWYGDGSADHTGIVEEAGPYGIRTIEGNSSDLCRQRNYAYSDPRILGYGAPLYEGGKT